MSNTADASEFSIYWRVKRDPDCIIWNNIVFLATLSLISSMARPSIPVHEAILSISSL